MVDVKVRITAADIFDYLLMHVYNSAWGNFFAVLGGLLIFGALIKGEWWRLVPGILIVLGMPVVLYVKSRMQYSAEGYQPEVHYLMEEDALTITRGGEVRKLLWKDMQKAVSTNKSIILYTSQKEAEIFPKQDLGEQRVAVIEMISTHMTPDKVKIKQ